VLVHICAQDGPPIQTRASPGAIVADPLGGCHRRTEAGTRRPPVVQRRPDHFDPVLTDRSCGLLTMPHWMRGGPVLRPTREAFGTTG
jgi:hypothetical protein